MRPTVQAGRAAPSSWPTSPLASAASLPLLPPGRSWRPTRRLLPLQASCPVSTAPPHRTRALPTRSVPVAAAVRAERAAEAEPEPERDQAQGVEVLVPAPAVPVAGRVRRDRH